LGIPGEIDRPAVVLDLRLKRLLDRSEERGWGVCFGTGSERPGLSLNIVWLAIDGIDLRKVLRVRTG
jgi:hypothetical protein